MDFCEKLLFFKDWQLVQNSKTNPKNDKNAKINKTKHPFLVKTKWISRLEGWSLCFLLSLVTLVQMVLRAPLWGLWGPLVAGAAVGTIALDLKSVVGFDSLLADMGGRFRESPSP